MEVNSFRYDKRKLQYIIRCEGRSFKSRKNIVVEHTLPNNVQIEKISAPTGYNIINRKIIFVRYPSLKQGESICYKIICEIIFPKANMVYTSLLSHDGDDEIAVDGITK